VGQYLDDPKKYSRNPAPPASIPNPSNPWVASMSNNPVTHPADTKTTNVPDSVNYSRDTKTSNDAAPADLPPSYAPPSHPPPASNSARRQYRPHTNPVIQAGQVRARDEVGSLFSLQWRRANILPQSKRCRTNYKAFNRHSVFTTAKLSQSMIQIITVAVQSININSGK
jgi:hypothetical protein